MRLRLYHTTRYSYGTPAMDSHNEVRLMPLSDGDQTCLDFRLTTVPTTPIFEYDLPTGRVHHFGIRPLHSELTITAESLVVTHRHDPFGGLNLTDDDSAFYRQAAVREGYGEYLAPTDRVLLHPETERIAASLNRATPNTPVILVDQCGYTSTDIQVDAAIRNEDEVAAKLLTYIKTLKSGHHIGTAQRLSALRVFAESQRKEAA